MKKNRPGLVFAFDIAILSAYWTFILVAMRHRIGAAYGQYELFETVSALRAIAVPLTALAVGAVFFLGNRLRIWQYWAVSAAAAAVTEILGNAAAAVLYGQSLKDTAVMLKTSFMFFMYTVIITSLWVILGIIRGITNSAKKINTTPSVYARNECEENRPAGGTVQGLPQTGPVQTYSGSVLPFIGYWLMWLAVCLMIAFFASGAVAVYLLRTDNSAPLFYSMGIGAALSVIIAAARGNTRFEVGGETVAVRRRNKVIGVYSFGDYTVKAGRTVHTIGGVIPIGTDRYIVLTDKSGRISRVPCRCFSEKTFTSMTDNIVSIQRLKLRQALKIEDAAIALAAENADRAARFTDNTADSHTERGAESAYFANKRILPLPGDDDFAALSFKINKEQMVSAERKRHREISAGLPICCVLMYAAWYFFVYRSIPEPLPSIQYITGGLIAVLFFILPAAVMTGRFAQERKRIPDSIVVESGRFIIDGQPFERGHVQNFKMTHPKGAKAGTASHRMHIAFFYFGTRYIYTIGSGIFKPARLPDYDLLYAAFETQRAYAARPETQIREGQMFQTTVKLTPFTDLTIKSPNQAELADSAGRIVRQTLYSSGAGES